MKLLNITLNSNLFATNKKIWLNLKSNCECLMILKILFSCWTLNQFITDFIIAPFIIKIVREIKYKLKLNLFFDEANQI